MKGIEKAILSVRPNARIFKHDAGDGGWKPSAPAEHTPYALVLFHYSDEPRLVADVIKAPVEKGDLRLFYSGGGVPSKVHLPEGWTAIPRPLDHADQLSRREWEELLSWAERPDRAPDELPRALHADFPRVATALLILCQGFEAMTSGKVADYGKARRTSCNRAWWKAPFEPIKDLRAELKRELNQITLPPELEQFALWMEQPVDADLACGLKAGSNRTVEEKQAELKELILKVESTLSNELGAPMVRS